MTSGTLTGSTTSVDAGALGFGADDRHDFVEQRRQVHRLQLQILGAVELQKSLHDLVEPVNLIGDDVDVLKRLTGVDDH